MIKIRRARFSLYRYQILPVDRHFQGDLLNGITSIEELLKQKNSIFARNLELRDSFKGGKTETSTKRLLAEDGVYVYRIAANRSLNVETKDFKEEEIENWPSIVVIIWNDPDKQLIAIQQRTASFQDTDTVLRLILGSVEDGMDKSNLRVLHQPLFEQKVFWDVISKNQGKLHSIEFEFITPNMANISAVVSDDLKAFAKITNSTKNHLKIEADAKSSLHIEEGNESLHGLVKYSSDGGGNISIKISGMKKKVQTAKTVREIEVDEITLHGPAKEIADTLKAMLPQ